MKKTKTKRRGGFITAAKVKKATATLLAVIFLSAAALLFIMPTLLTVTNSFMSNAELSANYGKILNNASGSDKVFISEKVNLKFIPDMIDFTQYSTVLFKSPAYLLKFWNSVILVLPIMVFQIALALGAAYAFSRTDGKLRSFFFFLYVVLMLMPYQVTLVPNYLVSDWLGILNTRWAIILPGIFSPFAVFILTKYMKRIPSSIIEAAKIDGAGEWQIFSRICVPLAKTTVYAVAILIFIDYWNMVEQPLVLLADTEMHPLSVFLSKINEADTGVAFAVATVYMILPILVFLYGEDYLVEGISYSGGIKG